MPIAYLDVPQGIRIAEKKAMMSELYDALRGAYPLPDDVRIFRREWPLESVSQDGRLDGQPARPLLMMHVPHGVTDEAKREMMQGLHAAISRAYSLRDFVVFMQEYPLDRVSLDGVLHSDNQARVEEQTAVYGVV